MVNKSELKVGDKVEHFGFNFPPLKWWERLYLYPRWRFNDFCYSLRKIGQTIRDGFPSEESFDFYSHCSKWSLPRLKQLKKTKYGVPTEFSNDFDNRDFTGQKYFSFYENLPHKTSTEKWDEILDKIIWSMENHDKEPDPIYPLNYDHRQIVVEVNDNYVSYSSADERKVDFTPVFEHTKRVDEGFELFGKHFRNLWD